jgi:hypothetical protein
MHGLYGGGSSFCVGVGHGGVVRFNRQRKGSLARLGLPALSNGLMTLRPLLYTHARHRRIIPNQHRTFLKYLYETIAQIMTIS